MTIVDYIRLFFIRRPAAPPEGEGLVYLDEETGRPVWQDSEGVHFFGARVFVGYAPPESGFVDGDIFVRTERVWVDDEVWNDEENWEE
jgi:hypothetical protein